MFLHYSDCSWKALQWIFFFRPHKPNTNYTSWNYENADCDKLRTSSVCFALWGKIYTPAAILPPAEYHWLNWSYDKFGQHDCLSWLWLLSSVNGSYMCVKWEMWFVVYVCEVRSVICHMCMKWEMWFVMCVWSENVICHMCVKWEMWFVICVWSRAQPMYRHTNIYWTMLPMYRIGKIPPIYIGNICS